MRSPWLSAILNTLCPTYLASLGRYDTTFRTCTVSPLFRYINLRSIPDRLWSERTTKKSTTSPRNRVQISAKSILWPRNFQRRSGWSRSICEAYMPHPHCHHKLVHHPRAIGTTRSRHRIKLNSLLTCKFKTKFIHITYTGGRNAVHTDNTWFFPIHEREEAHIFLGKLQA